jgi:mycothiol synthase
VTGPLSARVTAAAALALPAGPSVVSWRRATLADVDALVELSAALAAADHPEWTETREEIEEELTHSWIDLAADSALAEVDGQLVAYGLQILPPAPESIVRSIAFGGVRPSHRGQGIGRVLLAWHRERARQQLATSSLELPGWHMLYVEERNASGLRLAEHAGLPLVRWFTKMTRDLDVDIPALALPEGLSLVTPTPDDASRLLAARNDAFRDHWGSQPTSVEGWTAMVGQPTFRFDLSAVALDGDRVVGFALTQVYEDDFENQGYRGGYLPLIGVTRDWRRRGVAPALIAEVLRRHRAAGYEKVALDVDSENPSGALGLYTGMGFAAQTRSVAFVEEF